MVLGWGDDVFDHGSKLGWQGGGKVAADEIFKFIFTLQIYLVVSVLLFRIISFLVPHFGWMIGFISCFPVYSLYNSFSK